MVCQSVYLSPHTHTHIYIHITSFAFLYFILSFVYIFLYYFFPLFKNLASNIVFQSIALGPNKMLLLDIPTFPWLFHEPSTFED